MRTIAIDPLKRRVSVIDIDPTRSELRRLLGLRPHLVERLSYGDMVFASDRDASNVGFSIWGGPKVRGAGLVLGKLHRGEFTAATSNVEVLSVLTRWLDADPPSRHEEMTGTIRAILIDPERGLVEEVDNVRGFIGIDALIGQSAAFITRLPADDILYGKSDASLNGWLWRKDDFQFPGRCVIVGCDRSTNTLASAHIGLDNLRSSVTFRAPGEDMWKYNAFAAAYFNIPAD
jgi:hypothetical protein